MHVVPGQEAGQGQDEAGKGGGGGVSSFMPVLLDSI